MLLSIAGWGPSAATVGFISVVHLLGALGLILALLFADFFWAEQPRRWGTAASTQPPPPGERAGVVRPGVSDRHVLAGVSP
jgi:hypothetical protein